MQKSIVGSWLTLNPPEADASFDPFGSRCGTTPPAQYSEVGRKMVARPDNSPVNEAVSPSREADRKQSPPTLLFADNVAGVSRGGTHDNRNWSDPGVLRIVRGDGLRNVRLDPITGRTMEQGRPSHGQTKQ